MDRLFQAPKRPSNPKSRRRKNSSDFDDDEAFDDEMDSDDIDDEEANMGSEDADKKDQVGERFPNLGETIKKQPTNYLDTNSNTDETPLSNLNSSLPSQLPSRRDSESNAQHQDTKLSSVTPTES